MSLSDIHPALFYSRKDVLKNKKIFIFITLSIVFATANIIAVNGLMDGMIYDLVDNTVESSLGHLNVYPDNNERFIDGLGIKEQRLATLEGVEAYSPRLSASGVLSNKELSAPIVVLALDPDREEKVTKLLEKLDTGIAINSNDKNAILVTYNLAEDLKLKAGDETNLAFENGHVKIYKIKGIIRTGISDFDSTTVIMPLDEANERLAIDNKASVILVRLRDKELADGFKPVLLQNLGVNNIKTWEEETEYILSFAGAWESFSGIISSVGLIAAAVSIGIVIYINVIHKMRQLGIMKALGAKDSFVFTVFLMEAALFGLIGVLLGDGLGYLAIKYLEANPFYDAMMQTWISARYDNYLLLNATVVSFAVSVLSGLYPAIKASRVDIIKAIWGK